MASYLIVTGIEEVLEAAGMDDAEAAVETFENPGAEGAADDGAAEDEPEPDAKKA